MGHARCHAFAPEAFDLDDDGYAVVTPHADDVSKTELADGAAACPEQAITIET
jgi:ferredoxin